MNFQIEWHNDAQTILHTHMLPNWTWRDITNSAAALEAEMLSSVEHPVVLIKTFDGQLRFPNLGFSSDVAESLSLKHPNCTNVFFAVDSSMMHTAIATFHRLFPQHTERVEVVKSMEIALEKASARLRELASLTA